jgi:bifunctional NMN adenylyltransferase/nudix hydrolase
MGTKQYDYLVFIGRFQPLHLGHVEVIDQALRLADRVIVLVGSSNQPRTPKNPFTFDERAGMITMAFRSQVEAQQLIVQPLRDKPYNNTRWAAQAQTLVDRSLPWTDKPLRGGIIGHKKDHTSYYLDMFPQWGDPIEHAINELVNATDIRKLYLEHNIKYLQAVMPPTTYEFLQKFRERAYFQALVAEHNFLVQYKKDHDVGPHEVIYNTGDAVVIQSGHILLVQRNGYPGKGTLALPGGFLDPRERVLDCIIRELREETRLKVAEKVLRGSMTRFQLFDAPERSLRGRTLTHAAKFELEDTGKLPQVRAASDARKTFWHPLAHVREEEMFEDHYHIIDEYVGGLA